jgi:hypothetical protein
LIRLHLRAGTPAVDASSVRVATRLSVLALLALGGCQSQRAAISIAAEPERLASLVGEWHGEYASPATGRSGSIVFYLAQGDDHAHGDVLMIPGSLSAADRPSGRSAAAPVRPGPQILTIRFAQAEDGNVSGMLDRYWDPDCNCEVRTTFTGEIKGDRMEGTFVSLSGRPGVGRSTGWWSVIRRKPSSG